MAHHPCDLVPSVARLDVLQQHPREAPQVALEPGAQIVCHLYPLQVDRALMSVLCASLSSPSSLTNALCALSRSWMSGNPGDIQLPWPSSRAPSWASCGCRRPRRDSCGCRLPRRCRASGGIGRACGPARSPWRGRCHRCRSRQPPPKAQIAFAKITLSISRRS